MHWDLYKNHDKILHKWHKSDNIVLAKQENEEILYSPILVDFGKAKNMSAVQKKQLTENEKKIYKKKKTSHVAPEVIEESHAPTVKLVMYGQLDLHCIGLNW